MPDRIGSPSSQVRSPTLPERARQPEVPAPPQVSRFSTRALENVAGGNSESFSSLPRIAGPNPARAEAVDAVGHAERAYTAARGEVDRLNASLEQALRTAPGLRDPEAAERFRAAYMETHADAYARERSAAQELAASIRAAEPILRADGPINPDDASGMLDRMEVARAVETLARSSEYEQAGQIAADFGRGADAPFPPMVSEGLVERSVMTGMQTRLAEGVPLDEGMKYASLAVTAAGMVDKLPMLNALFGALSTKSNLEEFIRTGDPARAGAAGFAGLGTIASVLGIAGRISSPLAIGITAVSFVGTSIFEAAASRNDYLRHVNPALEAAFGVTERELRDLGRDAQQQALEDFARTSPEHERAFRMGGGTWLALVEQNREQLAASIDRIVADQLRGPRGDLSDRGRLRGARVAPRRRINSPVADGDGAETAGVGVTSSVHPRREPRQPQRAGDLALGLRHARLHEQHARTGEAAARVDGVEQKEGRRAEPGLPRMALGVPQHQLDAPLEPATVHLHQPRTDERLSGLLFPTQQLAQLLRPPTIRPTPAGGWPPHQVTQQARVPRERGLHRPGQRGQRRLQRAPRPGAYALDTHIQLVAQRRLQRALEPDHLAVRGSLRPPVRFERSKLPLQVLGPQRGVERAIEERVELPQAPRRVEVSGARVLKRRGAHLDGRHPLPKQVQLRRSAARQQLERRVSRQPDEEVEPGSEQRR